MRIIPSRKWLKRRGKRLVQRLKYCVGCSAVVGALAGLIESQKHIPVTHNLSDVGCLPTMWFRNYCPTITMSQSTLNLTHSSRHIVIEPYSFLNESIFQMLRRRNENTSFTWITYHWRMSKQINPTINWIPVFHTITAQTGRKMLDAHKHTSTNRASKQHDRWSGGECNWSALQKQSINISSPHRNAPSSAASTQSIALIYNGAVDKLRYIFYLEHIFKRRDDHSK